MFDPKIVDLVMNYRPIDDDFMLHIFKGNTPLVEYVLRIILGKEDLIVTSSDTQFDLGAIGYRGLRLDVFATDTANRKYNIEVQKASTGAIPQRARFHSSALDLASLSKGDSFEQLPETYVIFITEKDVLKGGKPTYTIERTILETNEHFNDGTHIVYVNGEYKDVSSKIGKLIHDFVSKNANEMFCEPMADITKRYKETPEGVSIMCEAVEKYGKEERAKGRAEMIKPLIEKGYPFSKIADLLDVSIEEVKEVAATMA